MSDTVSWGFWDCSNCGMTRISGRKKDCPRCSDPQNAVLTPSEDWYVSDTPTAITNPEELAQANAGPSWNCGYCNALNDAGTSKCSFCQRPLDFDDTVNREVTYDERVSQYDERPDPLTERIESDLERAQRALDTEASGPRVMKNLTRPASELPKKGADTDFYEDIRRQVDADAKERERVQALPLMKRYLHDNRRAFVIGAGALAVLVVVGLIVGVVKFVQHQNATVSGIVTVTELHWERSVEVEEYKTQTQSDWAHPGDARVQNSERKIRSWVTVHDGWRTEWYTDYESRPRTETYQGYESRSRTETYSGTCTRTVSGGNGAFRTESYSCPQTRTVYDQVPVMKTRTVYDRIPVRKSRQIEITHREPIWDTWYVYQVDRWATDRWVTETDTSDSRQPYWPEVSDLVQNDQPGDQVGEERVGDARKQKYMVIYVDSQDTRHSEHQEGDDMWSKLELGEEIPASYRARNGELVNVDWDLVA